jgi:lysozyme
VDEHEQRGVPVTLFGLDVSHWQRALDWPAVKRSGIAFVVARASIGGIIDARYRAHIAGARSAGIPVLGAYHFLYSRRFVSPEKQCNVFLSQIGDPDGLLTVLDVEKDGAPDPDSKPDYEDVRRFVERFREKAPGHPLILYAPRWYWASGSYPIGNRNGEKFGPLWASRYVDPSAASPSVLYQRVPKSWWEAGYGGWDETTLLQFTSSARVPGYDGRLDANAFRGTLDQLRLFTRPLPDSATEEPVKLSITGPAIGKAKLKSGAKLRKVTTWELVDPPASVEEERNVYAEAEATFDGATKPGLVVTFQDEMHWVQMGSVEQYTPSPAPDLQKEYSRGLFDGAKAEKERIAEKEAARIRAL